MFYKNISQLDDERPLLDLRSPLIVRALNVMAYDAANVGWMDLLLPEDMLASLTKEAAFPFLSANVRDDTGKAPFRARIVKEVGGVRVGVFGLVSSSAPASAEKRERVFRVLDPVRAAQSAVAELKGSCDLIIALTSLGLEDDRRLARAVPAIDVILGGLSKKVMYKEEIVDGTIIVQAGSKGMRMGVLEIEFRPGRKGRWVRRDEAPGEGDRIFTWTPQSLHKGIGDHPVIAGLLEEYRRHLKEEDIARRVSPPPRSVSPYAGARTCRICHPGEGAEWDASSHAGAFRTLVGKGQEGNPDCLACHVTAFREPGGYVPGWQDPDLSAVQCEACHGPGRRHRGPGMISPLVPVVVCRRCHNRENSPAFDYEAYLRRLGTHADGYFSRPPALP